VLQFIDILPF